MLGFGSKNHLIKTKSFIRAETQAKPLDMTCFPKMGQKQRPTGESSKSYWMTWSLPTGPQGSQQDLLLILPG
jgi:hypothetical protein